jgi:hypothetical protein
MYPVFNSGSTSARPISHDAAAAHALMQAIRREAPGVYGRVMERADELMVDWGFIDKVTP